MTEHRKPGRPKRDEYVAVSFTLSRSLADKIGEETKLRNESFSTFIERAVRQYFGTENNAIDKEAYKLNLIRLMLETI